MKQTFVTVHGVDPDAARMEGARRLGVEPGQVEVKPAEDSAFLVQLTNADGQFSVSLRDADMSAVLDSLTPPRGTGRMVTVAEIEARLADMKVTHGVSRPAIRKAIAEVAKTGGPVSGVPIASGTPPILGRNARVLKKVGTHAENKDPVARFAVKAGQEIGVKIPRTDGSPGRSVLGGEIPCDPGEDMDLVPGENTRVSEDGMRLLSATYGVADVSREVISVRPVLAIDAEGMTARMPIFPVLADNSLLTFEDVIGVLKEAGVVSGIREDAIRAALGPDRAPQEVIVAEGVAPVNGHDAFITFTFDRGRSSGAVIDGTDRIDYRERSALRNVSAGTVLAVKTPATGGVQGVSVYGAPIAAVAGRDRALSIAENVNLSEDGREYTAAIDGAVTLAGGDRIGVLDCFEIPGDVDYSTGNLDMEGCLEIRGWVRAGFSVRAKGDVRIGGGMEDAVAIAGGDLDIHGGIVGKDSGEARAGGTVSAGFAQNARIRAEGDIVIRDSLLHCSASADGVVDATAGKGRIIGGTVAAKRGVTANELGTETGIRTFVEVGTDERSREAMGRVEKELESYRRHRRKIGLHLASLSQKAEQQTITRQETGILARLARVRREGEVKEAKLAKFRKALIQSVGKDGESQAVIRVQKRVFSGTTVSIGGIQLVVRETIREAGVFSLDPEEWTVRYFV